MTEVTLKPLAPAEAIDFFRAKGDAEAFDWRDVWQGEHDRAFTVAKAMEPALRQDIREAVDRAIAEGMTLDQFRKELRPRLQARGWWGKQERVDPKTGETRLVQLGSDKRLRIIYETNLRTAYAAGRWERFERTKAFFPYLRYNHTPQPHPRPEHKAWDGKILPIEDSWWDTHGVPNGWGCKCYITQVTVKQFEAARAADPTVDKPARFPPKVYTNPRTGEVTIREQGIDPGWSYNPGRSRLAGLPASASPAGPVPAEPAPRAKPTRAPLVPTPTTVRPAPAGRGEAEALQALDLESGERRVDAAPDGWPLPVGPELFADASGRPVFTGEKASLLPLAVRALADPAEVRWIWRLGEDARPVQLRRHIARFDTPEGPIDVAADVAPAGAPSWSFATSREAGFDLDQLRNGVVAWARREPSAEELEALRDYTSSGYARINPRMRRGLGGDEQTKAQAFLLQRLVSERRLGRAATLYRGVYGDEARVIRTWSLHPGQIVRSQTLTSSSTDYDVAESFAGTDAAGLILEILAPAGARGMDVQPYSSLGTGEREILLPRNTLLRVLMWDPWNQVLTVELDSSWPIDD